MGRCTPELSEAGSTAAEDAEAGPAALEGPEAAMPSPAVTSRRARLETMRRAARRERTADSSMEEEERNS